MTGEPLNISDSHRHANARLQKKSPTCNAGTGRQTALAVCRGRQVGAVRVSILLGSRKAAKVRQRSGLDSGLPEGGEGSELFFQSAAAKARSHLPEEDACHGLDIVIAQRLNTAADLIFTEIKHVFQR